MIEQVLQQDCGMFVCPAGWGVVSFARRGQGQLFDCLAGVGDMCSSSVRAGFPFAWRRRRRRERAAGNEGHSLYRALQGARMVQLCPRRRFAEAGK